MTAHLWRRVVDVLRTVEDLGPDASGTLVLGATPVDAIYLDEGRICWIAARTLKRRLSDLLQAHANIPDADIARVLERCRTGHQLLGETLVAEGWLDQAALDSALRQHSAESLLALCREPLAPRWLPQTNGYRPRNSFTPIESLVDVGALLAPTALDRAEAELETAWGDATDAAAFVIADGGTALVPILAAGRFTVTSLAALATQLGQVPLAARELGTTPRAAVLTDVNGATTVVWWRDRILVSASSADRLALVSLVNLHLAA